MIAVHINKARFSSENPHDGGNYFGIGVFYREYLSVRSPAKAAEPTLWLEFKLKPLLLTEETFGLHPLETRIAVW